MYKVKSYAESKRCSIERVVSIVFEMVDKIVRLCKKNANNVRIRWALFNIERFYKE